MGVKQIILDFSGWTSAHGIPHVGSARVTPLRIFWACVFIGALGAFAYQMSLLVQRYLTYPISVQTALKFEARTFPVVTICNLNPYKNASMNSVPVMKDMLENYKLATEGTLNGNDPWNFTTVFSNETLSLRTKAEEHLMYIGRYYEKINVTLLSDYITFSLSDVIISCVIDSKQCDLVNDFKVVLDPHYGNCFQFNHDGRHESSRAGPAYGLAIVMKSDQSEYILSSASAGVRVSVGGHGKEPFPNAYGYSAANGFATLFGVKYKETQLLPAPHGNCIFGSPTSSFYYEGKYTIEGCYRSCYQDEVISKCGCADARYKVPSGKNYCSYNNYKDRICVDMFADEFNPITMCNCPQPCIDKTYDLTVSTAKWPANIFNPADCTMVANEDHDLCIAWYSKNTAIVEVYYARMNFEAVDQSEAYTFINLISDTGGQLGLWIGLSVITCVEFLSLIIVLIIYFATCRCSKKQSQSTEDNEMDDMSQDDSGDGDDDKIEEIEDVDPYESIEGNETTAPEPALAAPTPAPIPY